MKKLCSFFTLLLCFNAKSQTTNLSLGSIAIMAINTDLDVSNKQSFAFLALENIPGGTVINFTDVAWISGSGFTANSYLLDGRFSWHAPVSNPVKAGEVVKIEITIDGSVSSNVTAVRGTCTLIKPLRLESQDQLIAFQGTSFQQPYPLLWAFNTGANWHYDITNPTRTSDMPSVLNPADGDDYHVAIGAENGFFANGNVFRTEIIMATSRSLDLIRELNKRERFYTSSNTISSYPNYFFKIKSDPEPPIFDGMLVEKWNFENGLNSSKGIHPIRNTIASGVPATSMGIVGSTNKYLEVFNFPESYTSNPTGIEFETSTTGYEGIKLNWYVDIAPSAANSFYVQYAIDNGPWTTVNLDTSTASLFYTYTAPEYTSVPGLILEIFNNPNVGKFISRADDWSYFQDAIMQITLPAAVNNKNKVSIRISTTRDHQIITPFQYAPAELGRPFSSYHPNGKIRFDDIEIRALYSNNTATSTKDIEKQENSRLRINPSLAIGNSVIATHEEAQKGAFISVTDVQTGRTLQTQRVAEGSTQTTIAVSNLPKGHLLAEFINGDKKASTRFVKQ